MARTLRALVVANPAAGGQAARMVDELHDLAAATSASIVAGARLSVETAFTTSRFEAVELAARSVVASIEGSRPLDLIISVGGDGTAREIAEGIARGTSRWAAAPVEGHKGAISARGAHHGVDRGVPALIVLPAGTGNSLYRSIWSDRPWRETMAAALETPRLEALDLGRIVESNTAVLLGATSGFLADVTAAALAMTELRGRDRYRVAAERTLGEFHTYPGRVLVDGAEIAAGPITFAAVGGAQHRAGTFRLLPLSELDDGLLDVCVVGDADVQRFVSLALMFPEGAHLAEPEVAYAQGKRITLERTDGAPMSFEHDGDPWSADQSSVTIEVVPGAFVAAVPPDWNGAPVEQARPVSRRV